MKKIIYLLGAAALLGFNSCDSDTEEDSEEKKGVTVCDCVKGGEEMEAKIMEAEGDDDKILEIEEEYKDLQEACKKIGEERMDAYDEADEEKKEAMLEEWEKEAEACR